MSVSTSNKARASVAARLQNDRAGQGNLTSPAHSSDSRPRVPFKDQEEEAGGEQDGDIDSIRLSSQFVSDNRRPDEQAHSNEEEDHYERRDEEVEEIEKG